MYDEFVKRLESMTNEEIMQSIEQARKDSEDSEMLDEEVYCDRGDGIGRRVSGR